MHLLKLNRYFFILLFFFTFFFAPAGAAAGKSLLAIESLTTNISDRALIDVMTGHLRSYLERAGNYEIVSKKNAKAAGAGLLLSGSIVKLGNKYLLSLRITDTRTGGVIRTERQSISDEDLLPGIEKMLSRLMGFVMDEPDDSFDKSIGFGFLHIKSIPSGAAITLNDREIGQTPKTLEMLDAGRYRVKVIFNNFFPWEKEVVIKGGSVVDVLANLKTVYGSLKLTTTPPGAEVYIDGEKRGETPITIAKLKFGEYKVSLRKSGYYLHDKSVTVAPGEINFHSAFLNEKPEHKVFRLQMEKRGKKLLWAWGSLAVGGLLAAKGVTDSSASDKAYSEAGNAYKSYQKAKLPSDIAYYRQLTESKMQEGETKASASDKAMLLSVATLGLSLYHYFTLPSKGFYDDDLETLFNDDRISLLWKFHY